MWAGLWVGLANQLSLIPQMRDAIGLVVGWFVINFAKEGRTLIDYNINGCKSYMLLSGENFSM